jgi:hypothetical protein
MSWQQAAEQFDSKVGTLAERVTRRLTRRAALRTAILGGTTGIASLAIGERPALAANCHCGPTRRCIDCPPHGCPPEHHLCRGSFTSDCFNRQGYRCEWPRGRWIACMGLGHGYGYRVCYDCIGPAGCRRWCTCLGTCVCCNCRSAADVRTEQHRIQQLTLEL